MRKYCIGVLIALGSYAFAQRDMSWQDSYPNGLNWGQYLLVNPSFMGPNALPVPSIYEGRVEEESEVTAGYIYYSHQLGDAYTHATNARFYYPVAKGRVAVEITMMPYEAYAYSDEIANSMHSMETSGRGGGDIYINTYVQVLKQNEKRPDITIRYGLKTASGSSIENARHNDAAGYYMDFSVGKDINVGEDQTLRFFSVGGFYCWQLLNYDNMQNDALMYGLGTSYKYHQWKLKWDFGGYSGYKVDDKPLVMRMQFDAPVSKQLKLRFVYEKGLNDFPYNGYSAKLVYHFVGKW